MGIPEYEAKRYEGRISKGGTLISVCVANSDERDRAKKILVAAGGAEDVSSASAATAKSVSAEEQSRAAKPNH